MVRKRSDNEFTTIRVRWSSKNKFLKMAIGREYEADLFDRLLKKFQIKEIKEEKKEAPYVNKLNSREGRKR